MASPTSSDTAPSSGGSSASNSSENGDLDIVAAGTTKCPHCNELYNIPRVLHCFHTFCHTCLEKFATGDIICCPNCQGETHLGPHGVSGLEVDYAVANILERSLSESASVHCTGCKSIETNAQAKCFDCNNYLCGNCVMAHQFMHCFADHRLVEFIDLRNKPDKDITCPIHKMEPVQFYCHTCLKPACPECVSHECLRHERTNINLAVPDEKEKLQQFADQAKIRANDLLGSHRSSPEDTTKQLADSFQKAQSDIHESYKLQLQALEDKKLEALKQLDSLYNSKLSTMTANEHRRGVLVKSLYQLAEFVEKQIKHANSSEFLFYRRMVHSRLLELGSINADIQQSSPDLEFVPGFTSLQGSLQNSFGYVRCPDRSSPPASVNPIQPPIARPTSSLGNGLTNGLTNGLSNGINGHPCRTGFMPHTGSILNGHSNFESSPPFSTNGNHLFDFDSTLIQSKNQFPSTGSLAFSTQSDSGVSSHMGIGGLSYTEWSNGSSSMSNDIPFHSTAFAPQTTTKNGIHADGFNSVEDMLNATKLSSNIYPTKSTVKRNKMIYHCKFGEFGVMEGQFTEPSGVAVNAQNDIIVADTNNHRIQIFDKEGRFKFQFGECGKRDGQLLYPNRVAVVKNSGDIVVTERSPTHQVQIYNQYGQFQRKFGAGILQHPRGVTVDNKGRIVIVECKVMRVIIFDLQGTVLQKFGCSKHLEFPNGVVVNDKEEIFISDNRAHCVKVFSYTGDFLRQIGKEGITNYPIGVGINSSGEILIADNHNNFNLTSFTQDGVLISALESKVKHAQCFDVALMDDNSVVLASKDYRLYVYRYAPITGMNPLAGM